MLSACGNGGADPATSSNPLTAIAVTPGSNVDQIGESRQFTATGTFQDGSSADITAQVDWTTDDAAVATVSADGVASAIGGGTAMVTAADATTGVSGSAEYGVEFPAEGTIATPTSLTLDTTYNGQVGLGTSYYVLPSGATMNVQLSSMSDDLDLYVYDTDSTYSTFTCRPHYGRTEPEPCFCATYSGPVYIAVDGSFSSLGSAFALDLISQPSCMSVALPPTGVDEGSTGSPIAVTLDIRQQGGVGTGTSYYQVAVTQGERVVVNLTDTPGGLGANYDLTVYDNDNTFTSPACTSASAGREEQCALDPGGDTIYFSVVNADISGNEVYNIFVLDSDGASAAPVALYPEKTNFGTVNDQQGYYAFSVTAGVVYQAELMLLFGTADLVVYNGDSTFATSVCSATPIGRTPATCAVTAVGSMLYVAADGTTGTTGAWHQLRLLEQ